ncbi:lipopolysaccharide assembly protein LapA domain-containing protein [Ktedonobacter racemifer]|uniref:lipopolysaccharide assembly protein LapA domain-containing protein n=1 Tax=Ktedonobacter racemifer TaxID=363277 RepID=UPI0002EF2B0B|nr:LapA family protein [Ktedonobacter racemifer]
MFYLVLVMIVLAGGVITLVAVQNLSNTTQLEVLIWQAPALPAGLLILGAFILGALLLYLSSVGSAISDRKQIQKLRQRVKELEQQQAQQAQSPQPPQAPSATMPPQGPAGSGPGPIQMQPTAPIMQMPGMSGPLKN